MLTRNWQLAALGGILITSACASDDEPTKDTTGTKEQSLTYFGDVLPILEKRCLGCHRADGIAPFRLDDFASAKTHAQEIKAATQSRSMPPWGVTADGSCGSFADSQYLTDEELTTLAKWADEGAKEGQPRDVELADLPKLVDGKPYETPTFTPVIQGGKLAEFDEYRCFLIDSDVSEPTFITGYEVTPGTPEIVHHVLGFIIDPDAPASDGSGSNQARISAMDGASPDRDGWPCFGMAGEGVAVSSVPVTWAPGQGVVKYPGDSGVPLSPKQKLVLQVHYNLANEEHRGMQDRTTVKLQLSSSVKNVGIFTLTDPFLGTLSNSSGPASLEPGKASVLYNWKRTFGELGLPAGVDLSLYGVLPHMHQRGRKYRLEIGEPSEDNRCAADVQHWNFHFQRQYFYTEPRPVSPSTPFEVTCDFDTTDAATPVLPGWGTRNEMCLAVLYFTVPLAQLSH
ncbi:MAG: hypothetical protein QM784_26255 [Polyangiaceae bacterium]